jgi:uncharacterized protein YkwD
MRSPLLALAVLVGCGGTSSTTNEALSAAAAAGTAQIVRSDEERQWRRQPPRPQWCGDYDAQSRCYRGPVQDTGERDDASMSVAEGKRYALMYINGLRSLNGVGPLELDAELDAFAQHGSEQLARDHRPHGHLLDERSGCPACGETQGDPDGWRPAPLQRQIDEVLAGMMAEGPGGGHHDAILRPEWRKLGVGIVNPGGRVFLTMDFAP